jgi:DNA repair exonuclease SbcCD ATPase subunit
MQRRERKIRRIERKIQWIERKTQRIERLIHKIERWIERRTQRKRYCTLTADKTTDICRGYERKHR